MWLAQNGVAWAKPMDLEASLARMLHMISGATSTVLFPKVAAQPLDQVMTYVSLSSRVTTTVTGLIALALGLASPILLPPLCRLSAWLIWP